MTRRGNKANNLVKFIPGGIEVLLDGVAAVSDAGHTDLDIGVALPFYHPPHEVVLGDQVLGLHQMDSQHPLRYRNRLWYQSSRVDHSSSYSSFTSVAKSGSGEVCCGRVSRGLANPLEPSVFRFDGKILWPPWFPEAEGRGDGVVGEASSLNHKTCVETSINNYAE